mgnify:CR=1 FL=1
MAIFGSKVKLTSLDMIDVEEKITSAYFSDGSTQLLASSIVSTSLSDTNEAYYFGISNSSTPTVPEFHVSYGNVSGYGGLVEPSTISETKAVYKQLASLLLSPQEVTGGFFISRNKSLSAVPTTPAIASGNDTDIYVLSAMRSNMLDRINKKNWSIILSGSNTVNDAGNVLHLTDDSVNDTPYPTPAGLRYNIVSGSDGVVQEEASVKTYGWFYPDQGMMVFSGAELSASIPGKGADAGDTTIFQDTTHTGFGVGTTTDADRKNALRFINCLQPATSKLKFRDEENQFSRQYFCRLPAGAFNFSNSPTFVSGSNNEIRQKSMWDNPTTFVTQVQLYNPAGDVVAVGNLSTGVKKNKTSELTLKVKLTF